MDIAYNDAKLQSLCCEFKKAKKELGVKNANKLAQRLADLEACDNLEAAMSLPGSLHQLKHDRFEQFAMSLDGGCRLVFEVNQHPCPRTEDNGIKRREVTKIRVIFVGDYHD